MSIKLTLGALLIGSVASIYLSGTVVIQCLLYFQTFTKDKPRTKSIVAVVWTLDFAHTCMVIASNWFYLIQNFGVPGISDRIPWTVGATIALTAVLTIMVHTFFAHRVYSLSGKSWYITIPIGVLAICRVGFAMVTTSKLIRLKSFNLFVHTYSWVFTLGLSLAVCVDILIASSLCYFLNKSRTGFSSMDTVINSITLYTIETGLLTCIVTTLSLICWITMPTNLIFLAMHFAISKMYANALLATLNSRTRLRGRGQSSSDREMGGPAFLFPDPKFSPQANRFSLWTNPRTDNKLPVSSKVHISVEKTIDISDEDIHSPMSGTSGNDPCYPPSPVHVRQKHSDGHLTFDSISLEPLGKN